VIVNDTGVMWGVMSQGLIFFIFLFLIIKVMLESILELRETRSYVCIYQFSWTGTVPLGGFSFA